MDDRAHLKPRERILTQTKSLLLAKIPITTRELTSLREEIREYRILEHSHLDRRDNCCVVGNIFPIENRKLSPTD